MQVYQGIAMANDSVEKRVCYSRCRTTFRVSGKVAIKIPTVGQVARGTVKALQIDYRDADDGSRELFYIQMIKNTSNDLNTVEFVSVDSGREAECWASFGTMQYQYWRR